MARRNTITRDKRQEPHSERAQWAWDEVNDAKKRGGSTATSYATQVRKLPARIQVNGLGQTLGFLYSKSQLEKKKPETGERVLLCQLGARIEPLVAGLEKNNSREPAEIMSALVSMTPDEYRRCTHELMATAEWLKRFADGLFEKSED